MYIRAKNWQTVKEILHDVLRIEPSRRGEFLEKTGTTAEIRREVESLLACEIESANFMSLPITDFSKDFAGDGGGSEISLIGQRIGIYEIAREIGFGGMGAVYLATRADGKFEQEVAIKMLKREFNVEKIRQTFQREKEILARLSHQNIARLLDAGTTADGIPYLVMEYVEGVPIDKFCEQHNLPLKARLKLFNRVCEAVSFAHRNLIVHRDLKPSNILVGNAGEPKLLDFGISKLLDAENSEDKQMTLLGAMTPEYASPEQIRGESVTTATDIYSLGVILFKILTGKFPYDFSGKTNGNLLREITNTEPALPSETILTNKFEEAKTIFSSHLKGDVDNIILKSLCKNPEHRYTTVEQFSADIWRFVDGLPVLARRATFSYQARKFYGRNKISVLAGALILLSLFAGITIAIWQASEARAQARIASDAQRQSESETERARAETEKAEKISRFMSKVIAYANPAWYAEGAKFNGETKVIEVLDELSDKIDIEFAGQPDIQSELHHKFAEVYNFDRKGERADFAQTKMLYHARRALDLRRQFYGERHELVAKDMAYLFWAGGVEKKDAAKHLAEAVQMMRETNPHNLNLPYMLEAYSARIMLPDTSQTHEPYLKAVLPPTDENKYQIAERYLLEALPIFREHYAEDNQAIYANECKLAYAQMMQHKFAEAAPHRQICREAETTLKDEIQLEAIRKYQLQIAEITAANNR